LNAPDNHLPAPSRADTKPPAGKHYDFVLVFVSTKADIDKLAGKALKSLKNDGLLWMAYPKKSSGIKTDITRDYGWQALNTAGFDAVSQVAIDEVWSALRFRKVSTDVTAGQQTPPKSATSFRARLEKPDDGMDTAYISIPFDVEKKYGTKGQVKVKAWFDHYPYRGILANMGMGCHIIIVRKDIRQAVGKNVGDTIEVALVPDTEARTVVVPDDLKEALTDTPKAEKFFATLSYTNQKEYAVWITSAKKEETRQKRLTETVQKLLQGKKNPSQK
jgi:hypothetical protein